MLHAWYVICLRNAYVFPHEGQKVSSTSSILLPQVGVLFRKQRLTRSLLWGSEKSVSVTSDSVGGSCGTAPVSRPFMMRSAADATSAAIDYSKGDVEEGVVDSPPSRGPIRTPVCSPSPMKRPSSSRGRSCSPSARMEGATNRKLQLPVQDGPDHLRLEDGDPKLSSRATTPAHGSNSSARQEGERRRAQSPLSAGAQLPRVEDIKACPSRFRRRDVGTFGQFCLSSKDSERSTPLLRF